MKLGDIYALAIKQGIQNDPRKGPSIKQALTKAKKQPFDKDARFNPYADTRILYGEKNLNIKNILVGIDIGTAEILLAERLRQNQDIDLVISHHPSGRAYASFYEVMRLQIDVLVGLGIKKEVAEKLLTDRLKEVGRKVHAQNHNQAVDAARLLGVPFMCIHTPADNCVNRFLQRLMDAKKPRTLANVVDILSKLPEYKQSILNNCPPKIISGDPNAEAGRVFVEMTGGTEGSKKIFSRLSQAGVGTLVCMHLSEEHFNIAKDEFINIVVAGHIASDTLGLNLLLDSLEKTEKFNVIGCSGFMRVKR